MYFVTKTRISIGENQKNVTQLIEADNEVEASKAAIERQAADELDWEGDISAFEASGEVGYLSLSVKQVDNNHVSTLKEYL